MPTGMAVGLHQVHTALVGGGVGSPKLGVLHPFSVIGVTGGRVERLVSH